MTKMRMWGKWQAAGESICEGGQGRLYVVTDSTGVIPGEFILKELKNPRRADRFAREIETIAAMPSHPNVVELVDAGCFRDPSKPAYVMPKADGTLHELMTAPSEPKELGLLLDVFEGVCLGAAHFHSLGVVHRDLKPDNVLLFAGCPQVSDFGLALVSAPERLTDTHEAVGPRLYMAPELEDGRQIDVTAAADVYSLGKILYFLLSHGRIFAREKHRSRKYALENITEDPRLELFNTVLDRSVVEHPASRIGDASMLLQAFRAVRTTFEAHPRTSLLRRFESFESAFETPPDGLRPLVATEWAELLLVARHKAPERCHAKLLQMALPHLNSEAVRQACAACLVEWSPHLEHQLSVSLASAIVLNSRTNLFIELEMELAILRLASESDAIDVLSALARWSGWGWLHKAGVFPRLAAVFDDLPREAQEEFLIAAYRFDFPKKQQLLVELLARPALGPLCAEAAIAGLCCCATSEADDAVLAYARRAIDIESIGAAVRGIGLGAHQNEALVRRLAALSWESRVMSIGLSALAKAVEKSEIDASGRDAGEDGG